MLARSSTLRHPSGVSLRTPLLVPSFSSKGFRFDANGRSEIRKVFATTAEILTESVLISAYDVRYGHLPKPSRFPCTPSLIFVDSGGYETGADHDVSAIYRYPYQAEPWTLEDYQGVLDSWPRRIAAVFVNFDKESAGRTVPRQVDDARRLFAKYPGQLHCFLLKPTRTCRGSLLDTIKALPPYAKEIGDFQIIGVTEKELGRNMLERMEAVALLRRCLNSAGVTSPIQVFGSLDPLSSPLYFLSGAEIFDGLTWIRFAYADGQCVYLQNHVVLRIGLDREDDHARSKLLFDNYYYLKKLELSMRDFANTQDFSKLGPHSEFLKSAFDSLSGQIGGL